MSFDQPRHPIILDPWLLDPSVVHDLVTRGGPYWTVQHYVKTIEELTAVSEAGRGKQAGFIAPWFRGDWANKVPLVEGAEEILHDTKLIVAASQLFAADVVRPHLVYVNLNPPLPQVDPGHTDVPTFRGIDRQEHPLWLLVTMLRSGLFDRWYVPTATAVAWYYEGDGGGFRYWPKGPDRKPISRPCQSNSVVIGDNDYMFHCVEKVGDPGAGVPTGLTLDATLVPEADKMVIVQDGERIREYDRSDVRVSVSWKALCFVTEADADRFDAGEDALDMDTVRRLFCKDLDDRGVAHEVPDDLATDLGFMDVLTRTYKRTPTVFS